MNDNNKEKILFVDDSATVRITATKILSERYHVIEAKNGEQAWEILQQDNDIRIIFADIQMPVLNGLQLLIRLKKSEDEYLTTMPVIMITGESDSEATMRAVFEMGATDFIGKPFKAMDLLTRAYSYLKLSGKVRKLNQLAGIDRQTGLNNATQYKRLGEQALSLAIRNKVEMTVAYLEISDFHTIKLKHGENITSQILTTVAGRFNTMLRKEDVVARVGIARFAMIFPSTSRFKATTIIKRICDNIHNLSFDTGIKKINVKTTVGITTGLESKATCFDEVNLLAEYSLMTATTRKDYPAVNDECSFSAISDLGETDENKDSLIQSLLHVIDGDYGKLSESQLSLISDKFNDLAAFLEKHRPALPEAQANG